MTASSSTTAPQGRRRDQTGGIVTIAMIVLALLGVATVFHQPISALLSPGPSGDLDNGADEAPRRP